MSLLWLQSPAHFILLALCCLFSNISTNLFSLSGDIMLGGLFPINNLSSTLGEIIEPNQITSESLCFKQTCIGIGMKCAVDEINGNQTLLPGIKLGYEICDTYRQSSIIIKATLSFLTGKSSKALSMQCNYTDYETSMAAVIGLSGSEMVSVTGKLLGFFLMLQISYGATSDKFSDNLLYLSFFSMVPSDKWQVDDILKLIQEFGWNWVAIVGSDEEYGQQVTYQVTNIKVVVVFSLLDQAGVIRSNLTTVWIGSKAIKNQVTSRPNTETVGTIIRFLESIDTLGLFTDYAVELLKKLSDERANTSTPTTTSNLDYPNSYNISLVEAPEVQTLVFNVFAAIYSYSSAACKWIYPWKFFTWDSQDAEIMILVDVLLLVCQGSVGVVFLMHQGAALVMALRSHNLPLFLGEPEDEVCRLQLPFTSIFQTVTLSIILSVSLQILYVTEFPERAASCLHILRGPASWLFVLICCSVQAGLCGWFIHEGPVLAEYVANMTIDFLESFLLCTVSPSTGSGFMQVKPLHQYNLARDIPFSTLIYCVIWVIFIPIYMDNRPNNKNRSIVHVYFSLASNFGLLAHFCMLLEGVPPTQIEEEPQS
uniref:Taste receptor type 1 member 3 n=1 Tax=Amphilophus citrinellus TaxID=61819 RepID=A0A3Q0S2W6_AMPCI